MYLGITVVGESLNEGCRYLLKQSLEQAMALDFYHHISALSYKRTLLRRGYCNGYLTRSLLTSVGEMELEVPPDREGEYRPECIERYKRVDQIVDKGIRAMFLRGVSTGKVGEVLESLCGAGVSASYVSQVTKAQDAQVKAFQNIPMDDEFVFLFLDAVKVKIRLELKVKWFKLLVAYGIRRDGSGSLLSYRLATREGTGTWHSFLENLVVRGLQGHNLELIIMDGCPGLWATVEEIYPLVPHQLCWVHN